MLESPFNTTQKLRKMWYVLWYVISGCDTRITWTITVNFVVIYFVVYTTLSNNIWKGWCCLYDNLNNTKNIIIISSASFLAMLFQMQLYSISCLCCWLHFWYRRLSKTSWFCCPIFSLAVPPVFISHKCILAFRPPLTLFGLVFSELI